MDLTGQTHQFDGGDLFDPPPVIERRKWTDQPDEARRLAELGPSISYRGGKILRAEAAEYTDLYARQTLRRELVTLRRRVEGWAEDARSTGTLDDLDGLTIMRDLVTILDERLSQVGGVER